MPEPQKLPVVLGADDSLKSRTALTAAYAAGLLHLTWQGYYGHDRTAPTR
jgi:hypothetical protein